MATITAMVTGGNFDQGGTWTGGSAPTAADDAVIPATAVVTLPTATTCVCRSINVQALGTLAWASTTAILNVGDASGGAATFSETSTVTLTGIGTLAFIATTASTTYSLTTGAKVMPNITVAAGASTTISFADAVTATGATLTLTSGIWNWNGQTVVGATFAPTGSTARTWTPGASAITLTAASSSAFSAATTTNLTVTANTASVTCSGVGAGFTSSSASFNWNGLSVTINGSGIGQLNGACTLANFTRTPTAVKTDALQLNNNPIITGTCTLNPGADPNRLLILSSAAGTPRTITAATLVCTNVVDFQDITGAGAATWTTGASGATYFGNCGGNSGITFTTAATQTATGTASFTWSTHGWTSRVPLPQDDVLIPNAFVAGRTITQDMPRMGKSVSRAGGSGSVIFNNAAAASLFGSLTLVTGDTPSGLGEITFAGRSAYLLTSAAATWTNGLTLNAPSGSLSLLDTLVTNRTNGGINVVVGTLAAGTQSVTWTSASGRFAMTGGTMTASGSWSNPTTAAATWWNVTGGTITHAGSITLTAASANTRTFAGGGNTYGTLTYTVAGSTGQLTITGTNTFGTINFSDVTNARTLSMPTATSTTITTLFNVNGTAGKLMGVVGDVSSPVQQSCQYLSISSSDATNGPWYAGHTSNNGGSTGWIFGDPITATFAAPLGGLTATVAATPTVNATLAAPLGSLTATLAAVPKVNATLAAPLGTLTASIAATPTVLATLAATLGTLTATMAATPKVNATLAAPLGVLVATISATPTVNATLAATLGTLVATISAKVTVNATMSAPLGVLTATLAASVIHIVQAAFSAPLGALVATMLATVTRPALGRMTTSVTPAGTMASRVEGDG